MLTFLGIAFTLYGAMHFYAFSKIWQAFPQSSALGLALGLGGLVMVLSPFLLWQLTSQNLHGASVMASWVIYLWMGFLFLFCCTALILDFVPLLYRLADVEWPLNPATSLIATTLLSLALTGYGLYSARQIQLEKVTITSPKITSGKITIAQISDLHLGIMLGDKFLQRVLDILGEINPDIVVATGDVIDGQGDDLDALARRLRSLQPPGGLFAVTGNHEYFAGLQQSLNFLHNAGFRVLRGQAVKSCGIVLSGVDDQTAGTMGLEEKSETRQALASFTKDDFIVLLKHQPVVDANTPFDLQLSGHVHGGQIFPFGLLTRLVYRVHTGLSMLDDDRWLYVSRGTGTWGPPMRFFAAPEITLITIASENK